MSKQALVTVNELPIEVLDQVNDFIKGKLESYGIKRDIRWGEGTFSKMVGAAQDRAGMTSDKTARRQEFQRIQAVFVLEDINKLILGILLKNKWEPRFGGTNPKGDVATMKFVQVDKAATDVIGKLAKGMQSEQEAAQALREARGDVKAKADRILRLEAALKERGVVDIEAEVISSKPE